MAADRLIFISVVFTLYLVQVTPIIHETGQRIPHKLTELYNYNPKASRESVVISGNVRFTVLTERVIRIEEIPHGAKVFEDRATLAVLNRKLPVPTFQLEEVGDTLLLRTSYLEVKFISSSESVSNKSLEISPIIPNYFQKWRPGMDVANGNLYGTVRTLDGAGILDLDCNELNKHPFVGESLHCKYGIVSRIGWSIIDDTTNPCLDPVTGWWNTSRHNSKDIYFFGFGKDYKAALFDYTQLSGKSPMMPRAALGIWWTRWYNYDQLELEDIYDEMKSRSIPLDIMVLDMNWHMKPSWGGYTWDKGLFPHPQDIFQHMKDDGVKVMVNLHDASGVSSKDDKFQDLVEYLGSKSTTRIKFSSCDNQMYAFGLEDIVVDSLSLEGRAVDYFWIDWQQGGKKGGCAGGEQNPTIWLNRIRANKNLRHKINQRGLILSRWGGYGSHRYQVGFSGDVDKQEWSRLAYQPYFTLTASNLAFGYWSHDITGPLNNPELTVRWIQWAAFSPILRFHDRGTSAGECNRKFPPESVTECSMGYVWQLPARYYKAAHSVIDMRLQFLPYNYNLMYEYFRTGVSPIRPMYYNFPLEEMAYSADRFGNFAQFMLGDDILVSPIVAPADSESGFLVKKRVWIPPGSWIEYTTGLKLTGPGEFAYLYDLEEVPLFCKAGSAIPMLQTSQISRFQGLASKNYENLHFKLYIDPYTAFGFAEVYQDDGISLDYLEGTANERLRLEYSFVSNTLHLTLDNLRVSKELKSVKIQVMNIFPLRNVSCRSRNHNFSSYSSYFDGRTLSENIILTQMSNNTIEIFANGVYPLPEKFKARLLSLRKIKSAMDEIRLGKNMANLVKATSISMNLEYFGNHGSQDEVISLVKNATDLFSAAEAEIENFQHPWLEPNRKSYTQSLIKRNLAYNYESSMQSKA